jgi:hypothetical protein
MIWGDSTRSCASSRGGLLVPPCVVVFFMRTTRADCFSTSPVEFLRSPALVLSLHPFQAQVPYSPRLPELFFGEEMMMAVRLFTHGWDVYAPPEALVFHQWSRAHRPFFREIRQPDQEARAASERQVRSFLCTERKEGEEECGFCDAPAAESYGEEYALGKVRTVREFAELCSLNFCKKRFEPKAKTLD